VPLQSHKTRLWKSIPAKLTSHNWNPSDIQTSLQKNQVLPGCDRAQDFPQVCQEMGKKNLLMSALHIKHWKVLKNGVSDSNVGVGDVANCMQAEEFQVICNFQVRSYCWVHTRARSRILTYFILLLAIFFLLVVLMSHCFKCYSTCGQLFLAPSGLTHQQKIAPIGNGSWHYSCYISNKLLKLCRRNLWQRKSGSALQSTGIG
jgi:hypothetical protein